MPVSDIISFAGATIAQPSTLFEAWRWMDGSGPRTGKFPTRIRLRLTDGRTCAPAACCLAQRSLHPRGSCSVMWNAIACAIDPGLGEVGRKFEDATADTAMVRRYSPSTQNRLHSQEPAFLNDNLTAQLRSTLEFEGELISPLIPQLGCPSPLARLSAGAPLRFFLQTERWLDAAIASLEQTPGRRRLGPSEAGLRPAPRKTGSRRASRLIKQFAAPCWQAE